MKSHLLHPEILGALASAGHSSRVLISDGNFPHCTRRGPNSELVFLNLAPGMLKVTEVLEVLVHAVPFEDAVVMKPNKTGTNALKNDPPIFKEFSDILTSAQSGVKLRSLERFKFYEEASSPDVCLTIATGEDRIYASLLLTIGVIRQDHFTDHR